jgi:hypothetical protein
MIRLLLAFALATSGLAQSSAPASSETTSPEEDRGAIVFLQPTWVTLDGARPADGRPEVSTTERSLGLGAVWEDRRGGTWGAGVVAGKRQDANLAPLPGGGASSALHALELRAFHSRDLARDRRASAYLGLRGGAENPGDVSDALAGVLWYGRDRPTSSTTRFGWGVVALYQTGEGFRMFPAPTFEWDPPGGISLIVNGPRSELRYDLSSRWQLALNATLTLRRYRMADGTLFADRQQPVRLGLRRMMRGQVAFEVFAGRLLGREWEVRQRPGLPDATLDVDGGTFYGFQATVPLSL